MYSSPAKKFLFLILFLIVSSLQIQARDSRSFSKVAAAVPNQEESPLINNQEQEPIFTRPEHENRYGLYGHESGQLPHSSAESEGFENRHLPRNYNPVAYVTQPEGNTQNSYTNDANNYYDSQQEDISDNYRYNGGSSFNSEPRGTRDNMFQPRNSVNSRENYFYDGESVSRPQGMSDTRTLEDGKYFYDINAEKYSNNHPYEVMSRAAGADSVYDVRRYYEASDNSMRESDQNQYDQFQDEGSMP